MGLKGRIALNAALGVVVIGVVSANAGQGTDGGPDGPHHGPSASSEDGAEGAGPGGDTGPGARTAAFGGDGAYRVGADIRPGTYRTTGNTGGHCRWERAEDASGSLGSALAGGSVGGTGYVTVEATDKLFKSSGCAQWRAVPVAPRGRPGTSMDGDGGMFRVGADIVPGTYRSSGNAPGSCSWERTEDATHEPGSVLAEDDVTGTAVVTVRATDGYFRTTGCGDWKKTR
ncbi:hypothetical protein [Streptomyces sp. LaPpAH-108]|uniref:hypothetical protein n=1 Tax=Streptomyces sp. LaPpAH-108 TaxID=1155714 RepID=UPI00037303AA|nr:hypothetical protein [Streptomyces sp. LaPpAH-108]